jgi:hypothetical protein
MRGGFTTHAMNMGQRFLQLNNTYTVNQDGSITLHVAQLPPNANLFQPGPAFLFVTVNGIPSNGTYLIVGNGQIGTQPLSAASVLPASVRLATASGSASGSSTSGGATQGGGQSHLGVIIGCVVGAVVVLGLIGAVIGICVARRKRAAARLGKPTSSYPMEAASAGAAVGGAVLGGAASRPMRGSDSSAFLPLGHDDQAWNGSTGSLSMPYRDYEGMRSSRTGMSVDIDPYTARPMQPQGVGHDSRF